MDIYLLLISVVLTLLSPMIHVIPVDILRDTITPYNVSLKKV